VAVITRLAASGERSKKVRVYLDGKYAFSLEPEVALSAKLRVDRDLSQSQVDDLGKRNDMKRAVAAAERLLSFRPRSEKELAQKLAQKKFDPTTVTAALDYLREHKLVDDAAFARYWAENRAAFSPRSRRLVTLELRQKGVDVATASGCSEGLDDEAAAYEAAARKVTRMSITDYEGFRRRMGDFLKRRGFSYETIDHCLKRLWQEHVNKE
jgi:regulatory protein